MYRKKLTLKEFSKLTSKMKKLYEDAGKIVAEREDNFDSNTTEIINNFIIKYKKLQDKLLSYDLSDIPFESWEDVTIGVATGEEVDFSKTHANIDFDILILDGRGNFKGCNVKNIHALGTYQIDDKLFDDEAKKNNPSIFLSNAFSDESSSRSKAS